MPLDSAEKVMVGMSGGVDSSVCAALLMDMGHSVTGVTLRLYDGEDYQNGETRTCCSLSDAEDAKAVCAKLGIPHYVFNFKRDFEEKVIQNFAEVYKRGGTPNPCIDCNRYIKFDAMLRRAQTLGFSKIATGHYATVRRDSDGRYLLCRSADPTKDQTYVLYCMTQEQLAHTLFPLGGLTKSEVRELARQKGLVTAKKPDSQDICFVPDGDYASFIERYSGCAFPKGDFVDESGVRLGAHGGVIRYTIGQRKGLGIAFGKPTFVLEKNAETNTVVLGDEQKLFYRQVLVDRVNWIAFDKPSGEMPVTAKLRYSQKEQEARLIPLSDNSVLLEFKQPQRAPSPGQSAVFYQEDVVVGGGVIRKGVREHGTEN